MTAMARSGVFDRVSIWLPFQNPDNSGLIKREASPSPAPGAEQSELATHPEVAVPAGEGEEDVEGRTQGVDSHSPKSPGHARLPRSLGIQSSWAAMCPLKPWGRGCLLPKEEGKRGYKKVAARVLLWMGWSGTSRTSEWAGRWAGRGWRQRPGHAGPMATDRSWDFGCSFPGSPSEDLKHSDARVSLTL